MPDPREAVSARRQQASAEPRPVRLGADPRAEVAEIHETADLWRVYLQDWVIVYTSDEIGEKGVAEAQKLFSEKYLGRVRSAHVAIYSHGPKYSAVLKLYLPLLRGEFKSRDAAQDEADVLGGAEVVQRNSAADYKLREYGVKKVEGGTS